MHFVPEKGLTNALKPITIRANNLYTLLPLNAKAYHCRSGPTSVKSITGIGRRTFDEQDRVAGEHG
jgi:hypothetical protein